VVYNSIEDLLSEFKSNAPASLQSVKQTSSEYEFAWMKSNLDNHMTKAVKQAFIITIVVLLLVLTWVTRNAFMTLLATGSISIVIFTAITWIAALFSGDNMSPEYAMVMVAIIGGLSIDNVIQIVCSF